MRLLGRSLPLLCACGWFVIGCGSHQTTQRVFDGHLVVGPYVEPEAYAAFAEGVYLEERGDPQGAMRAYRRAQDLDSDSPAIAARVGALLCKSHVEDGLAALETSGVARDYAPAWAERARCLHGHGRPEEALEAARRAVMLAPSHPDANLLAAQIYRERGEPDRARAWLLGWVTGDPGARAHREAIAEQARALGDEALASWVSSLSRDDAELPPEDLRGGAQGPAAAASLADATEPEASSAAPAVRDAALETRQRAELALQANPRDGGALVAALSAAWLAGDQSAFAALLRDASPASPPPPDVARRMSELIRFCAGDAAAEAWSAAYQRATGTALPAAGPATSSSR
jgi:hypothetical protein